MTRAAVVAFEFRDERGEPVRNVRALCVRSNLDGAVETIPLAADAHGNAWLDAELGDRVTVSASARQHVAASTELFVEEQESRCRLELTTATALALEVRASGRRVSGTLHVFWWRLHESSPRHSLLRSFWGRFTLADVPNEPIGLAVFAPPAGQSDVYVIDVPVRGRGRHVIELQPPTAVRAVLHDPSGEPLPAGLRAVPVFATYYRAFAPTAAVDLRTGASFGFAQAGPLGSAVAAYHGGEFFAWGWCNPESPLRTEPSVIDVLTVRRVRIVATRDGRACPGVRVGADFREGETHDHVARPGELEVRGRFRDVRVRAFLEDGSTVVLHAVLHGSHSSVIPLALSADTPVDVRIVSMPHAARLEIVGAGSRTDDASVTRCCADGTVSRIGGLARGEWILRVRDAAGRPLAACVRDSRVVRELELAPDDVRWRIRVRARGSPLVGATLVAADPGDTRREIWRQDTDAAGEADFGHWLGDELALHVLHPEFGRRYAVRVSRASARGGVVEVELAGDARLALRCMHAGAGVAGALLVVANDVAGDLSACVWTTSLSGRAVLEGLTPGPISVEIHHPRFFTHAIELRADRAPEWLEIELRAACRLRFVVDDGAREPLTIAMSVDGVAGDLGEWLARGLVAADVEREYHGVPAGVGRWSLVSGDGREISGEIELTPDRLVAIHARFGDAAG